MLKIRMPKIIAKYALNYLIAKTPMILGDETNFMSGINANGNYIDWRMLIALNMLVSWSWLKKVTVMAGTIATARVIRTR